MAKNTILTSSFDEGYDSFVNCLESITNLANSEDTAELLKCIAENDGKAPFFVIKNCMPKVIPYLRNHKEDALLIVSEFFCRTVEETNKKSIIAVAKDFIEMAMNDEIKDLFFSAQNMKNIYGSVPTNTEEER